MDHLSRRRAVGVAALLALLAGCGGSGEPSARDDSRASSSAPPATPNATPEESEAASLTAYDPPTRFEEHGGIRAPGLRNVALDGQKAYSFAADRLVAWDLAGGEEIGTVEAGTSTSSLRDPAPYPPGLGTVEGKRYAVAAFRTSTKGAGSAEDAVGVEVVAMDAETGREAWRTQWDLPAYDESYLVTYVAGVAGRTAVVVSHGEHRSPATYGIDLVTRKVTWSAPDFKAQLVQGTRVIGQKRGAEDALALAAIDGGTGRHVWTGMEVGEDWSARAFAPDRIWVGDPEGRAVVDSATGEDKKYEGFGEKLHSVKDCVYDRLKSTFCFSGTVKGGEISAYARTGKRLWRVGGPSDGSGRKEMRLESAFHGAVYVYLSDGPYKPIVLDGATGADKITDLAVAPQLTNAYVGLVVVGGEIKVYRATG
ncbi:PQQ-binding-like beta-propeller repeat protein [Streptomyces sp. SBC-4]|nr:PQQ-binding-like beta-propeller repeat protein [Streptomyces sp. SBC-4]MDV5143771.1 PQQ-binding-like beta-propeller repeat protein [Streptomyces sp. SBC-4]